MSLSKKLILSFLGLTILVLVATLGLARWSFERGFLDYVNALEESRLERVSNNLATQYINADNSWQSLSSQLLENSLQGGLPRPPPHRKPRFGTRDPKIGNKTSGGDESIAKDAHRPPFPPPGHAFPPPNATLPPATHDSRRPRPRFGRPPSSPLTALFDNEGKHLAGSVFRNHPDETIRSPIMVQGEKVGEIRSLPRRDFDSPQETAFSRQQIITSIWIGVGSLALATLVSFLLAKILLTPLRRMMRGVNQLSKGDYSVSMTDHSKDELGRLMGDINHLSRTLKENQSSRRRWLADISHELRTPLTVLTGEIETLKDGIRPFNKEQLESLDQEVERMRHLTNDLYELSLSDIGGLRYEFKPVNLNQCIDRSVRSIKHLAKDKNIDVQVTRHANLVIDGDAQRMDQLFTNLLNNSLAYTNAPGKVEISISGDKQHALIQIQDTPPGVSCEECEKLFDPLYRQDASRNRRTAGAGLGLSICRNIVKAHRGKITANPSTLGGLYIQIELPRIDK